MTPMVAKVLGQHVGDLRDAGVLLRGLLGTDEDAGCEGSQRRQDACRQLSSHTSLAARRRSGRVWDVSDRIRA